MDTLMIREAAKEDIRSIRALLKQAKLPVESIEADKTKFYVGTKDNELVGVAGLEFYGKDALLRSVAVRSDYRNKGYGEELIARMISEATKRDVERLVLLTETAEGFFAKRGFKVVDRASLRNDAMKKSSEFTFACPASAVCMLLEIS
jgi:amino-acid N-acetyltransferase